MVSHKSRLAAALILVLAAAAAAQTRPRAEITAEGVGEIRGEVVEGTRPYLD